MLVSSTSIKVAIVTVSAIAHGLWRGWRSLDGVESPPAFGDDAALISALATIVRSFLGESAERSAATLSARQTFQDGTCVAGSDPDRNGSAQVIAARPSHSSRSRSRAA